MGAPDLDQMEEFLIDFGLIRAARTSDALYMRGAGAEGCLHVTETGPAVFKGFALRAESMNDLHKLAALPNASNIETVDEPAGGQRVRLTEPNGYQVEVIFGADTLPPINIEAQAINSVAQPINRSGELRRVAKGPAHVQRLGHVVLATPNPLGTAQWFRDTFGFIRSDDLYEGEKDNVVLSFNRLNRGETYVDHHSVAFLYNDTPGFQHVSFEVQDIDDVFVGHDHLKSKDRYEHMWGIGRHLLGSQVYDYWADPWGRIHENWADTDRFTENGPSNLVKASDNLVSQWGSDPTEAFFTRVCP
jgi:hypothetical protein